MRDPRRMIALMLLPEGAVATAVGGWLVFAALFGGRVTLGRTGDVIGPPDELVDGVWTGLRLGLGALALAFGAAGLLAGRSCLCRTARGGVTLVLVAYALPWGALAGWALLRASGSGAPMGRWLFAAGVAAIVGLLHFPAARAWSTLRAAHETATT